MSLVPTVTVPPVPANTLPNTKSCVFVTETGVTMLADAVAVALSAAKAGAAIAARPSAIAALVNKFFINLISRHL